MAFKRKYSRKYSKKSRRGKSTRKYQRGSFQKRVKKAIQSVAETKYYDIANENTQLYHNYGYSNVAPVVSGASSISLLFNPWADIQPGTGRMQRIGDKIMPRGISLKLWLANKLDRPNLLYRIMVVRAPKTVTSTIVGYNNIYPFQNPDVGGANNCIINPLDSDRGFKALYDRVISLETGTSGTAAGVNKESHKYVKLWIKRKTSRPVVYDQGNQIIINNPLLIYVIPYDSYGTLFTDNVASLAFYCRLYYKDV